MIGRGASCARHRDVLLDFIDRREVGPDTDAALDHLDRCPACESDLEATAMAVAALRRLHREAQAVEPAPDAWDRLRVRVDRPRGPIWRWRTSLAGLAVGAGLVATLLAPVSMWTPRVAYLQEPGTEAAVFDALGVAEQQAEWQMLDQRRQTRARSTSGEAAARGAIPSSAAETGWTGPDGLGISTRAPAWQTADGALTMTDETLQQRR